MQTFLPYESFWASAAVLDDKRLGNQCYRECLTLYNGGWENHPASIMWRPHLDWLAEYAYALACEMIYRRDRWQIDTVMRWVDFWHGEKLTAIRTAKPWWLGDERLHASHRAKLYEKDPEHYGKYFGVLEPMEYFWPSKEKAA
jgi:hypothetical protein